MSVRFFGEYLVKKGVIKPANLVTALIEQMSRLPALSKVVYDNGLLPAEQMLDIFHRQQTTGEDFVAAAAQLGAWNAGIAEKVEEAISKLRTPIGQILVQRGDVDLKNLTKHLDDFLAQAEVAEAPAPAPAPVAAVAPEPAPVEEEMYQPGIIAELEDMFDERKRRAVKVALAFLKDKNPPDASVATKLLQDSLKIVRTVLGLVKIFGLTSLTQIFQEMERVLNAHSTGTELSAEKMQGLATVLANAMEEAWTLRESISQHCTDTVYMRDAAAKNRFLKVLSDLQEIK